MLDPGTARGGSRTGAGKAPRRTVVSCRVCGTGLINAVDRKLGRCATCPSDRDEDLFERLREWRARVAAAQRVPPFVVFTDVTLAAIAERRPAGRAQLAAIAGIGPRKLELYAAAVAALVDGASVDDLAAKES
jgi:DNA helicase-2/ATP-dependent DNA helicase PcrA